MFVHRILIFYLDFKRIYERVTLIVFIKIVLGTINTVEKTLLLLNNFKYTILRTGDLKHCLVI